MCIRDRSTSVLNFLFSIVTWISVSPALTSNVVLFSSSNKSATISVVITFDCTSSNGRTSCASLNSGRVLVTTVDLSFPAVACCYWWWVPGVPLLVSGYDVVFLGYSVLLGLAVQTAWCCYSVSYTHLLTIAGHSWLSRTTISVGKTVIARNMGNRNSSTRVLCSHIWNYPKTNNLYILQIYICLLYTSRCV